MDCDTDKVDETVLALLYLTTFQDRYETRAWKVVAWEVLDRLHEEGYIGDLGGKAKSVELTEAGEKLSAALFAKNFGAGE